MGLVETTELKCLAEMVWFDNVGVTPAIPIPEALAAYRDWLGLGFHGEMGYLAEHEILKQDPTELLPGAKSVIAVSMNYYQEPDTSLKISRYALGRDYHRVMRQRLKQLSDLLDHHYRGEEFRACVDSSPILERAYAHLAGLGWFGKNTMLIDSKRGSWFFIGILLTTIEFEPTPPSPGGCGTCRKCIEACPTGAIVNVNDRWQVDSNQCISYQTIEKKGELNIDPHGWVFGCDVCQEVCPFNEVRASQPLRGATTREPGFLVQRTFPSLAEMADISHEDWDELTRGSAIRRTGYEGLKRNAQKALESSRDRLDA